MGVGKRRRRFGFQARESRVMDGQGDREGMRMNK